MIYRLLLIASILAQADAAMACSCIPTPPPLESLADSGSVFSGTVEAIEADTEYGVVVSFAVNESWKGVSKAELQVKTGNGGGDCGFHFQIGETYLVYASGKEELWTGICSRTRKIESAESDLRDLGTPEYTPAHPIIEAMKEPSNAKLYISLAIGACLIGVLVSVVRRRGKSSPDS